MEAWIGSAVVAAFIAGLINVAGWFITFRHARHLEKERRAERVTDTQTALLAEIRSDLKSLSDIDLASELAVARQRLSAAPPELPYTPFVPKDSGAPIFSAIVRDIVVLPTEIIDPVVLHYKLREAIAHFSEDLRAETFRGLPVDRKMEMLEDYLRLKAHAALLARDAVAALERSLGLPPSVNNAVADPSDQKSASAGSAASVQTSSLSVRPSYKAD